MGLEWEDKEKEYETPACPKCGHGLDTIYYEGNRYFNGVLNSDGDDDSSILQEEIDYYCPYCHKAIARDLGEAKRILGVK